MKNKFLHKILFAGSLLVALAVQAQPDQPVYAVTDSIREGVRWNYLHQLDMQNGSYNRNGIRLLNNNDLASTSAVVPSNGVTAIAYDKRNKRLYYTPLLTDRLVYIDLRTMRTYVVTNHFTGLMPKASDQSNIITRMVIGDDDKGYALTNDGLHLYRFKTNNSSSITDLGSLVDAPGNDEMSVHNQCTSFGGDLIADDDDHLYLFTLRNHVFKISLQNKVAKYLGTISGLPENFTTSGVAVDRSREKVILVSNAANNPGVYRVHLRALIANRLNSNNTWATSDLASSYILRDRHGYPKEDVIVSDNSADNDNIRLYPNPVIDKEFKIQFTDIRVGVYTVDVMDVDGKLVTNQQVTTGGKSSIVSIHLPEHLSSGIYIVRITDNDKKAWFSGKIVVQQ